MNGNRAESCVGELTKTNDQNCTTSSTAVTGLSTDAVAAAAAADADTLNGSTMKKSQQIAYTDRDDYVWQQEANWTKSPVSDDACRCPTLPTVAFK